MNEVRALVEAFDAARGRGERCALATVVSVEGSSYRRPGARLLVCEGGASTGTISAGCLEADVVGHAERVIRAGAAKLVEYDTASTGGRFIRSDSQFRNWITPDGSPGPSGDSRKRCRCTASSAGGGILPWRWTVSRRFACVAAIWRTPGG